VPSKNSGFWSRYRRADPQFFEAVAKEAGK
jgi:hypothetical protein